VLDNVENNETSTKNYLYLVSNINIIIFLESSFEDDEYCVKVMDKFEKSMKFTYI